MYFFFDGIKMKEHVMLGGMEVAGSAQGCGYIIIIVRERLLRKGNWIMKSSLCPQEEIFT